MAIQIIKRVDGEKNNIETIGRISKDAPQISYNSEGRIAIRIPQYSGDVLIVLNRPLSRELIMFIKNGILESPMSSTWCSKCANEFDHGELPF